jgi:hypothetical protein
MKSFLIASVTVLGSIPLSQLSVSVPGLLLLILFLHQLYQGTGIPSHQTTLENGERIYFKNVLGLNSPCRIFFQLKED